MRIMMWQAITNIALVLGLIGFSWSCGWDAAKRDSETVGASR